MKEYEILKLNKERTEISSKKILLEIFLTIHNNNFLNKVDEKYFLDIFKNDNYEIFIVKDEKIKGYIIYYDTFDVIDLFEIAIENKEQGKGLGEQLLSKSIEKLFEEKKYKSRQNGETRILLEVNEKNVKALKLYEKSGFLKISIRKNYYGSGEHGVIMEKGIKC